MVPAIRYFIGIFAFLRDRCFFQISEIGVGGNHPKVDLMFIDDSLKNKFKAFSNQ